MMISVTNRKAKITVAVCLMMLAAACSSSREDAQGSFEEIPAGQLYNEGLAHVEAGLFKKAASSFDEVDKQHPYSHWAKKSMVMSAYSHYRSGDFENAAGTARRFITLHPADKDAAYAAFILAESYNDQIPEVSRDQSNTAKALEAYQYVIRTYPDSPYAREAEKKIEFARDQIAGKEMSVGRFYLGKRNYLAAVNRFRTVVTAYQTTRHVEEALLRLTEAYLALGLVDEAQASAAVLGHNFPDSEWYKEAYARLGKEGLEPINSSKSWLSKAFG